VGNRLKIIIGAGVTALLAAMLHGPAGQGQAFLTDLRARSTHALAAQGLPAVRIAYPDAPATRTARLSGTATPAERAKALAIVSAVEGNARAVWPAEPRAKAVPAPKTAPAPKAAPVPSAAEPSAPAPPMSCQQAVETALRGRTMHFRTGSAWLDPDARRLIADVAAAALPACRHDVLEVRGRSSGHATAYRAMARERAARVRDALVAAGLPAGTVRAAVDVGGAAGPRVSIIVTEGGA